MQALPALRGSRRRQAGFSLAEVLVAVALLGVIMLALFSLVSMGVQRAYSGRKMTESTMLAQSVMERVNTYEPHLVLTSNTALSTVTKTWTTNNAGVTVVSVNPTTAAGGAFQTSEQDAITALYDAAKLQVYGKASSSTLSVTMTATPGGRTFANATLVRMEVDLTWTEWGSRAREVHLQALNLRTTP